MNTFDLIVNPAAGLGKKTSVLAAVKPIFEAAGFRLNVLRTEYPGHARQLAEALSSAGSNGVGVIGGDGTLHEVINGILSSGNGHSIPIAPLGGGTGNSLMYDLGSPDPIQAAQGVVEGKRRKIDVAEITTETERFYSFNVVGFGITADVNQTAERLRMFGRHRYNCSAIVEILRKKARRAWITIDGEAIDGTFTIFMAALTRYTGRGMQVAPAAQLDDGLMDTIIVRDVSRLRLLSLFARIFKGTYVNDPAVEVGVASEICIRCEEKEMLVVDGEAVGDTPCTIRIIPRAIQLLA